MKYNTVILLLFISLFTIGACKKEKDKSEPVLESSNEHIQIISLTANPSTVKAWDTTLVKVVAAGNNLQYSWEADHGVIDGSDSVVSYWSGECCVGVNTITCTVSNDASTVSDTLKINVTSYFE